MADANLGSATLHARLNAGNLTAGLQQMQRQTEQTFTALGNRLIGLGKAWSLAVTTPLTTLAGVGVRSAMQLETFAASLEVLVGDVERANRAFDELYEFSANTPFTWRSLTEGVRVLAAFGVEAEDLVPTLSRLGDIAAGVQTPIEDLAEVFGRVLITGRFSMEEVNRLAERGIPVYTELAKQLGVTEGEIRDLVSAGKVGFPEMERMVRDLTSEGGKFFGMMEAQSDTVAGRLNRLRDSFEQVTDIIGERLLPLFDRAIAVGQRLTDWFVALDPAVQTTVVTIGAFAAAIGPLALGLGTIVNLIPTLTRGLALLRAAGLAAFGPVGWVALGVIAVSSLASALAGRQDSLEKSIEAVNSALAENDSSKLLTALDEIAQKVDGPVKQAFIDLQAEIRETGRVTVEQASLIKNTMGNLPEIIQLQGQLSGLQAQRASAVAALTGLQAASTGGSLDEWRRATEEALASAMARLEERMDDPDDRGMSQEAQVLTQEVRRLTLALESAGPEPRDRQNAERQIAEATAVIASLDEQIGALEARIAELQAPPEPTTAPPPGRQPPTSNQEDDRAKAIRERIESLMLELRSIEHEYALGLRETGTVAEASIEAIENAARDLIRLEADIDTVKRILGQRLNFDTDLGPAFQKYGDHLAREDARLAERLRSMDITTTNSDLAIRKERELAMAREEAIRSSQALLAEFARNEQIRAQQYRMSGENASRYTEQLILQGEAMALAAREGISLTEALDRLVITASELRAAEVDDRWRPNDFTLDQNGARAEPRSLRTIANNLVAAVSTAFTGTPISFMPGSFFRAYEDHLAAEDARLAARIEAMDITTTNTDLAIKKERELAMERERMAVEHGTAVAAARREQEFFNDSLRFGGNNAATYTEQLVLQGKVIALAAREGISLSEALDRLVISERELRAATDPGGGGRRYIFNDFTRATRQEREEMTDETMEPFRRAADQFAETVFNAGLSFADAVVEAIKEGDIPGIIQAGLQGAGSIFGSMGGLGSIPFLGGTLGVGTLIAGGLGILGTIIGAASSGSDRAQREREQRRSASLPAINLNFTVNQTNHYQGGPSQPENEQAFRRQANVLFEELYRRHLGPRFDRIEQRLGIAGAGA